MHGDAFARDQFLGDAHRFAGIAVVVARDHLELLAEHAALGVDLFDRQFPALLVGLEEGGLRLVAVELADLDGVLRRRRRHKAGGEEASNREILHMTLDHDFVPFAADNRSTILRLLRRLRLANLFVCK